MAARPRVPDFTEPTKARPPIPQHTTDPVASLQPWPVEFTHDGVTFQIPALSAATWLSHLMPDELDLETMMLEVMEEGHTLLESESLSQEDFEQLCMSVLEHVGGRPWWITLRLVALVKAHWNTVGSELLLSGVDASRMSLSGWLDVVFLVSTNLMNPDMLTMFYSQLEMPPAGVAVRMTEDDMVMTREAFLALGH